MSNASATGFTLSGSWRTQWDWAVVEWNRDNGFDHPLLRYLPDLGTSDLSGVTLSYVEQRTNCLPIESNIYPSLDWPYLRLWVPKADGTGTDQVYYVRIADYATPVVGSSYQPATVTMALTGSVTTGKRVGLAFMGTFASPVDQTGALIEQHCYFNPSSSVTTLAQVAAGLANSVNQNIKDVTATASGNSITCTYMGAGSLAGKTGENGNRVGVYGYVQWGSNTGWAQQSASFSNGQFPSQYQITLPFGNLQGVMDDPSQFFLSPIPYKTVPTQNVRKIRWMWAADLQPAAFQRSEFQVTVSQWSVTDNNRVYSVAGPGSRRIEDLDPSVQYSATAGISDWSIASGNYSGSRSHVTTTPAATCTITYTEPTAHRLYVGSRRFAGAPSISVSIDGQGPTTFPLALGAEDILVRLPLGSVTAGTHTIAIANAGSLVQTDPPQTAPFYFDFLEIACPSQNLPDIAHQPKFALATDWDTLHSQALPAERTAWMISKLGFTGRVNHYVGALWWYELTRPGQQFPSVTATLSAPGNPTGRTTVNIGGTVVSHLNIVDETSETIAIALAQLINQGTTSVWASASGNVVTITWRFIETDPANPQAPLPISSTGSDVPIFLSATALQGGTPGTDVGYGAADPIQALTVFYRTDLTYPLRLNRACRDWSAAFFAALKGYGIDCVATFSAELAHADPTAPTGLVGMAQRYADGSPVVLSTPAVQTNFSPASLTFWQGVYTNMAALQAAAGMVPYLQSGEVQWWYFPGTAGMPYYDAYTTQQFTSTYGSSMGIIPNGAVPVAQFPREASLLQKLLGDFTAGIRTALRTAYPNARYEILYPGDVNSSTVYPFNGAVNLPVNDWTPQNLTCFKTEGLSFALPPSTDQLMPARSLDASLSCLQIAASLGFPAAQRSHLVGISDAMTAWNKEVDLAVAAGMESVVLFALDQYCLIGYPIPPFLDQRWSKRAA